MAHVVVYSGLSHCARPNITIGEEVRKTAHKLIKTTVDCACGNELEQWSHGSGEHKNKSEERDVYNEVI